MNAPVDTIGIAPEELDAVLGDVLSIYQLEAPVGVDGPEAIVSRVVLQGESPLSLTVSVPNHVAGALALSFFGGDVGPEDARDAVSELSNVLGGAVKTLLDGTYVISIPEPDAAWPPVDGVMFSHQPLGPGLISVGIGVVEI